MVHPVGTIKLLVRIGEKAKCKNLAVDFLAVDAPSAYNAIIGRPNLNKIKSAIATHLRNSNTMLGRWANSTTIRRLQENVTLLP